MLTTLVFSPLMGALLLMLAPRDNQRLLYKLNIAAACIPLVLVLLLWPPFLSDSMLSLMESRPWIPTIGASYALKIDGLNLPFVTMIAFLVAIAALMSTPTDTHAPRRNVLLLLWEITLLGAFLAWDYVLFIVFWAAGTIPIYYLIETNSEPKDQGEPHHGRLPETRTFVFSSLLSIVALASGLLILSASLEAPVFAVDDLVDLVTANLSPTTQWWAFLAIFIGSALRLPIFPIHIWLPLTLPHLPISAAMVLVGGFIPLGIYGFLRFAMTVLPDANVAFTVVLAMAGLANLIFGALASLGKEERLGKAGYQTMIYTGTALIATATFSVASVSAALFTMIALGLAMSYTLILGTPTCDQDSAKTWPFLFYALDAAQQLRLPGFPGFIGLSVAFSSALRGLPKLSLSIIVALILIAIDYGCSLSAMLGVNPASDPQSKDTPKPSLSCLMTGTGAAAILLLVCSITLGSKPDIVINVIESAVRQIVPLLN